MDLLLTDGQGIRIYLTEALESIQLTEGVCPDWTIPLLLEIIGDNNEARSRIEEISDD